MSATWTSKHGYEILPGVLQVENLLAGRSVRNALEIPTVRSLVPKLRELVGPSAFAVRGILFDKTAASNWKVPWHQDLTITVRSRIEVPGFSNWSMKAGVCHVQAPVCVLERMVAVRV